MAWLSIPNLLPGYRFPGPDDPGENEKICLSSTSPGQLNSLYRRQLNLRPEKDGFQPGEINSSVLRNNTTNKNIYDCAMCASVNLQGEPLMI